MSKKHKYIFKITVIGPEDRLLEDVLRVINEDVVAIDGIRFTARSLETENLVVQTLTMAPQQSALDAMESMTFTGANAVLIVLDDADPKTETIYRNKIREHLGSGIPTRVCIIPKKMTREKKKEIARCFDEMVEELTPAE
ncbi:MAG: hypothetical protein ACTSUO_05250 [Candidatus Thorarchaeota archaeon]